MTKLGTALTALYRLSSSFFRFFCGNKVARFLLTVYTDCGKSDCDGKYTNWVDSAPRTSSETCVFVRDSGRWDVSNCNEEKSFMCEFGKIRILL